ncbi:hypothetical protein MC885_010520 [Smutsia gigantea]|nr:hypothetical protein MC885_010520 [Smutsia gigantea]
MRLLGPRLERAEAVSYSMNCPKKKPLVLEGIDLGACTSKWMVDYLSQVGGRKEVKIHVAAVAQMDFISKNFVYRTLPFDKLVQRAAEEKHKEFFISEVMDNFLIQVTGKKRVVLFSPRDAQYLYLSGTKSEVLNIDKPDLAKYLLFSKARALWFHNVTSEEFGVGVNVFWKHLPSEYYDKTDTYGNKDPTAASRAAQILDRALKTLAELPEEYRDFYARQMVLHIQDKAYSKNFE